MKLGKKEICWMCGGYKSISRHHVINKSMTPKKNCTIPLCKKCHKLFHIKQPPHLKLATAIVKWDEIIIRYVSILPTIYIPEDKFKNFNGSKWVRFK